MAIQLNDNLKINVGKPIDSKYLNGLDPYVNTGEVFTEIPIAERYIGLTVNVNNIEYWFKDDLTILVEKFLTSTGGTSVIAVENIGSGTGEVYAGVSSNISGDTAQLRSIRGSGSTTVVTNSDEIIIFSSGSTDGVVSGATYNGSILTLQRTEGLPDVSVSIGVSGITDGVVSGGTISGSSLILERTIGLPDVNIDLSSLSGSTTDVFVSGGTLNSSAQLILNRSEGQSDINIDLSPLSGGSFNTKQVIITTGLTVAVPNTSINTIYGASGTTGYTLPAVPTTGAEITFVDELGTANSSNITIDGNGIDIYDDTFALINTDNGSLTIVYNGLKWNVTAFVS